MNISRHQKNALSHLARKLGGQQPERPDQFGGWAGMLAKTGPEGIPARQGTTAGKATDVKLCMIDDEDEIIETEVELTVYNVFSSRDVAGDTYITLKPINGTRLAVDAEDCN